MYTKTLPLLFLAATAVQAHMHLYWPPTLKGDNNPNTKGDADPLLNYPYGCCGKEAPGPCKGHLNLLGTDEAKPVAQWAPGQTVNFTLSGAKIKTPTDNPTGGTHSGGSCQAGFSVDKGKTFKVATSWEGNCPLRKETVGDPSVQIFKFTVPADLPAGDQVFAWSWVNREQEFNMNCAVVTIGGGSSNNQQNPSPVPSSTPAKSAVASQPSSTAAAQYTLEGCECKCPSKSYTASCSCTCANPTTKRHLVERKALAMHIENMEREVELNAPHRRAESVAFSSRPDMLIGIDYPSVTCKSVKNTAELKYPNPGPDVVQGDGSYPLQPPTGC